MFRKTLIDRRADESDRLIAAELAGDTIVMNDDMASTLLTVVGSADEPEQLRTKAAISSGPSLQQVDTDEFEDPDDVPFTEGMFHKIQDSLEKMYLDNSIPKEVRWRVLEASVRAPANLAPGCDQAGLLQRRRMLTAVFAMGRVRGFDNQILTALKSTDAKIQCEAVKAAGHWGLDAAWLPVVELVNDPHTPKPLLIAAIGAVGTIRRAEARNILDDLAHSEDEEIAEAANEAMAEAEMFSDAEDDEEEEWIN